MIYVLELSRQILQEIVYIHNLPMQPRQICTKKKVALVVVSVIVYLYID